MGHPAPVGALALIALLGTGCQDLPFGEVLVVVDSEASVPAFVGRLRVDLYDVGGAWYESREIAAPEAAGWPLSFSVFSSEPAGKRVRLRLRGFPEDGTRDYRGERFAPAAPFVGPRVAHSASDLCQSPPLLAEGETLTLRRGAAPITTAVAAGACKATQLAGSVAARVVITESASYRFEVVGVVPGQRVGGFLSDTTLFLRSRCDDPASQLACNDVGSPTPDTDYVPRLIVTLDPGEYLLVTGANFADVSDVSLRWAHADAWDAPSPDGGAPPAAPILTSLLVDGADLTPATEPQPNLAIDRLIDVQVRPARRATVAVLLRGECLGTQADLAGGRSCVDTAGVLAPVAQAPLVDGLQRPGASVAGSWAAEAPLDCTGALRPASISSDGIALFDEEVCVPGGAYTVGSAQLVGRGDQNGVPQQVAVVDPMRLDKFEVSVARYREALRQGFKSPDDSPTANDGFIDPLALVDPNACTFSGDAAAPHSPEFREKLPLNCVSWTTARALCRFLGGDLPTEVQWEWAATAASRPAKTVYPTGDTLPDCSHAVYGRSMDTSACIDSGVGPTDLDDPVALADLTPGGVAGMTGNVSEWALDSFHPYGDPCWWQAPLRNVQCWEDEAPLRAQRGGHWAQIPSGLPAAERNSFSPSGFIDRGVRCARAGGP